MSSCIGNNRDINTTFIIEPLSITGGTDVLSACTAFYTNDIFSCSGDSSIMLATGQITINKDLIPNSSNVKLGSNTNRFREINTMSGTSTYWTATSISVSALSANSVDFGLDTFGNQRILTANNSIFNGDILNPGNY